jgi:hypothetical protein
MRGHEVKGLQATLKVMRQFDKSLLKELKKDLTREAQPIFADARSRMPSQPTSHWGSGGRLGWSQTRAQSGFKVSVGVTKRVRGMKGSFAAISLYQANAAGALFDQAGQRGKYKPPVQRGAAFVARLDRDSGKAQRGLWPASLGKMNDVRAAFIRSIHELELVANARMKQNAAHIPGASNTRKI